LFDGGNLFLVELWLLLFLLNVWFFFFLFWFWFLDGLDWRLVFFLFRWSSVLVFVLVLDICLLWLLNWWLIFFFLFKYLGYWLFLLHFRSIRLEGGFFFIAIVVEKISS
jgi:hypothetical protein